VKTANINMGEGNKGYLTTKQQKKSICILLLSCCWIKLWLWL